MPSLGDVIAKMFAASIAGGITTLLSLITKTATSKELLAKIEAKGEVGFEVASVIGGIAGAPFGMLPMAHDYWTAGKRNELVHAVLQHFRPFRLPPEVVFTLYNRLWGTTDYPVWLLNDLREQGWSDERIDLGIEASRKPIDALALIELWRRGKLTDAGIDKELRIAGFKDDQIATLKELRFVLPNAQDLVRFAVREVYTPEIAEKFGQFEDFPDKAMEDAGRIGVDRELLSKYWAAHWDLPGATLGFEMLHRGTITEEELKTLLRALDVMPFWRDKLIDISWNVPTRVDVRRFWEMGTIDEPRLRKIYTAMGYHGEDLEDYVLWTKIYVAFPDLIARYKNGWIKEDDVLSELKALGMPADKAQELWETKFKKAAQGDRLVTERDLTKGDIVKGVKIGRLSYGEGQGMLVGIGYDESEAAFLLDIYAAPAEVIEKQVAQKNLTAAEILSAVKAGILTIPIGETMLMGLGYDQWEADVKIMLKLGIVPEEAVSLITASSPQTPLQYQRLVESYRKAQGLPFTEIPQECIDAEITLSDLRHKLSSAKVEKASQEVIDQLTADVATAEVALAILKTSLGFQKPI